MGPGARMDDRHFSIAQKHLESLGRNEDCQALLRTDALLTLMDTGESFAGPGEICAVFDNLHLHLFSGASRIHTAHGFGSQIVVEAQLRGIHQREFAGVLPTGKPVTLDYALAYDISGGSIAAIRAYWNLDAIVRQLRGGWK